MDRLTRAWSEPLQYTTTAPFSPMLAAHPVNNSRKLVPAHCSTSGNTRKEAQQVFNIFREVKAQEL